MSDLAAGCRLLEARGDVDRISGDERLPFAADDDLARVDADPRLETVLRDRRLHLRRGANRTKRVVLVRDRDAEDGHDRVADELLHRAAVALEDDAQILEVAAHARPQRLGVGRLAERGRADEVAEEDRDDLALLARRLRRGERRPARAAEPRVVGVLAPTARACRHARSLRGSSGPEAVERGPQARGRDDVAL